ncbi:MAG: transporter substrate-binding domain-containing protein [Lachnospiraceae bacterium]|nr:transporter substrate-binding domain-containing protein [Lachnospiraceae bacterium]
MKKRTISMILAATLLFSVTALTGCGSTAGTETAATAGDLLAQIQERGTITVAMEGTWAPWTYHDESNELVGYDVEVAQNIAERLGVEAEFVEGEWDGLFAGLDSGRYDMVVNGVEVTDERAEKYDFTEPYCYIHTALIVRDDNEDIKSFENLDGKTTANSIASTYMTLAESYGATATGVDSLDETINMVLAGRADATLNADVSFYDYMNVHPDAALEIVALTDDASEVCIPLRRGAETESLRAAINQAIEELRADGTLAEISEKYFGSDISHEK